MQMIYTVGRMAKQLYVSSILLNALVELCTLFKDEDILWLKIIECLKKTGMSIANAGESCWSDVTLLAFN